MYFRVGVFAGIVCLFLLFFCPNFMLNAELKLRNLVVFLLSPVYYFRTARYVVETRSFFSTNYPLLSLFVCLLCEKCCTTIFVGRISIHCIYGALEFPLAWNAISICLRFKQKTTYVSIEKLPRSKYFLMCFVCDIFCRLVNKLQ